MTEQEFSRIKTNMISLLGMQIESVKMRMDILATNGTEVLGTTDKKEIAKATEELFNKWAILKHLYSQAEHATTPEELKAIHDKTAQILEVHPKQPKSNSYIASLLKEAIAFVSKT